MNEAYFIEYQEDGKVITRRQLLVPLPQTIIPIFMSYIKQAKQLSGARKIQVRLYKEFPIWSQIEQAYIWTTNEIIFQNWEEASSE